MTLPANDSVRLRERVSPISALTLAAITLLLAIAAGAGGIWQLRDALTFDRRAMNVVGLRAGTLRLLLDADGGVGGYARTHRPAYLLQYLRSDRELTGALAELHAATVAMAITGGPEIAANMERLHARWRAAIAPALGGVHPALGDFGPPAAIVEAYRHESDRLVTRILARFKRDNDATESRFVRIALLFGAAVVLCALSVGLAARRQLQVHRARARSDALLRERDILFEQGRTWSRAFQRAVLPPRLPSVCGCTFDAIYEAGTNDAHVGGDWYDAVRLIDGRILISIGDVAGSGLEAAVIMGVVRQIMRGIAQLHANPALMLDAADRALQIEYADIFVTAWVGVVDLVTQTLTYASAGHPPPLLADAAGNVRELSETALPLGLREGHQAAPSTVTLSNGSTLVLYTDGLSESTHDVVAGNDSVREATTFVARAPGSHPAAAIAQRVLRTRALDDVAILVVRTNFPEVERHIARTGFALADADAARTTRDAFIALLAGRRFSVIEQFNAELVFGELLANVVRHAPESDGIEIAVDSAGPQIVLHVFDRGPGFRHISRLPSDLYSESGRGLFLIAALTDDFTVTERPGGGSHARAVFISRASRPLVHEAAAFPVGGRSGEPGGDQATAKLRAHNANGERP